MNPLQFLLEDQLVLVGAAQVPSNTVFVDNVVECIQSALVCPVERSVTAVVGDEENWTWGQYYGFFADRLGCQLRTIEPAESTNGSSQSSERRLRAALFSEESKAFAKRLLHTDPIGTVPRWVLESFPSTENWIRRQLNMDEPDIYRRNGHPSSEEMLVTARRGTVSIESAKALGYTCAADREHAMNKTYEWARYAGIIPANVCVVG